MALKRAEDGCVRNARRDDRIIIRIQGDKIWIVVANSPRLANTQIVLEQRQVMNDRWGLAAALEDSGSEKIAMKCAMYSNEMRDVRQRTFLGSLDQPYPSA